MTHWHVIQTKPHRENDVTTMLTKANLEAFNPKIRDSSYRGTHHFFKTKPLFPSYVFLNIDFSKGENIHLIKYTRGVSKILCAEGKPLPIDETIITTIHNRTNAEGIVEYRMGFKKGETIRVKKGLLKDLIGVIERPASHEERICVLLKLVNYNLKAHLHWTEVEKIAA